jgi:hypothetical protein
MKKLGILFLCITVCCFSCKRKPEDVLARINSKRSEINGKLKKYTKKQVDNLTSSGSGDITGYYRDEEVKKIVSEHYSDSNRIFSEYYFDEGMLIFIVEQKYEYNAPISYTQEKARARGDSNWYDDKKTRLEIDRFYFDKNKLIKWVEDETYEVPVNSSEFLNKQSSLWAETVVLIKELKEQSPNP